MRTAIRVSSLFFIVPILVGSLVWIGSFFNDFTFRDGYSIFPVWKIALMSTIVSIMYPAAYHTCNNGKWGKDSEIEMLFLSSLYIIPLLLVFPPPEAELDKIHMSDSLYILIFFGIWFAHGVINAWHVHLLKHFAGRETCCVPNAA